MKIAILSDEFPPEVGGGAGKIAYEFAKGLRTAGHAILVITITQDQGKVGVSEENGISVARVYSQYHPRWRAWRSIYNPRVLRECRKLLVEHKPDIVHAHNIHQHISYGIFGVCKKLGIPTVHTFHDAVPLAQYKLQPKNPLRADVCSNPQYMTGYCHQLREERLRFNPFRRMMIRHSLQSCKRLFAVSDALAQVLRDNGIRNVETFHNGIDMNAWDVDQSAIDRFRTAQKLEGRKVVLFGGRISGLKGGFQALEYIGRIKEDIPNVTLLVMGKVDAAGEKLLQTARERGIADNVSFTGWLDGVDRVCAYHVSDVVITPSLYLDPFPTINLEAGACGKPVVTTCLGGSKEAIENEVSGYVVNPHDVEAFSSSMRRLLADQDLARRMREKARERINDQFSIHSRVREYLTLVETLV